MKLNIWSWKGYQKYFPKDFHFIVTDDFKKIKKDIFELIKKDMTDINNYFNFSSCIEKFFGYNFKFTKHEKEIIIKTLLEHLFPDQKTCQLDYIVQSKFFEIISKLMNKKLCLDLTIDWKKLYMCFKKNYFTKYRNVVYPPEKNHAYNLIVFVNKCSYYFPKNSAQEMMNEWLKMASPFNTKIFSMAALFSVFLPCHDESYKMWKDGLFKIWNGLQVFHYWDIPFLHLFSKLARRNLGKIKWNLEDIKFLFGRINQCFDLPLTTNLNVHQMSDEYEADERIDFFYPELEECSKEEMLVSYISKLIVYLLQGDIEETVFSYLRRFLDTFKQYFLPQIGPEEDMPQHFGNLVHLISELTMFFFHRVKFETKYNENNCERSIKEEFKLTKERKEKFCELILPFVLNMVQLKDNEIQVKANYAAKHLCLLFPEFCIPKIFEHCFQMFESFLTPVQVLHSLKTFAMTTFPMVRLNSKFKKFKKFVRGLMYDVILTSININDPTKVALGLQLLNVLMSSYPLVSIIGEDSFCDWSMRMMEIVFILFHHYEVNMNQDKNKIKSKGLLRSFFDNFVFQMTDDIFEKVLDKVLDYVRNESFGSTKLIGYFISSLCVRNSERVLSLFIPLFMKEISEKNEDSELILKNLTSSEIEYFFSLLGHLVKRAGGDILRHKEIMKELVVQGIKGLFSFKNLGELLSFSKFIKNLFRCNLEYYREEYYPIAPSMFKKIIEIKKINDEMFCKRDNVEFNWKIPSVEQIQFSREMAETIITFVEKRIKDLKGNTKLFNLLYFFRYCLSGFSILLLDLDDLKKNFPHIEKEEIEKIKIMKSRVIDIVKYVLKEQIKDVTNQSPKLLLISARIINSVVNDVFGRKSEMLKDDGSGKSGVLLGYKLVRSDPRIVYARKIQCSFFNSRIFYFFSDKPFSKEKITWRNEVFELFIQLSVCNYREVRIYSQNALMSFIGSIKLCDGIITELFRRLIQFLKEEKNLNNVETMYGVFYLLQDKIVMAHVLMNFNLFIDLLSILIEIAPKINKEKIKNLLFSTLEDINLDFHQCDIKEEYLPILEEFVKKMSNLVAKKDFHWKIKEILISLLQLLIRPNEDDDYKMILNSNLLYPSVGYRCLILCIVDDSYDVRSNSVDALNLIFSQIKYDNDYNKVMKFEDLKGWYEKNGVNDTFIDKNHLGYNYMPETCIVSRRTRKNEPSSIPERNKNRSLMQKIIEEFFGNEKFVDKFLKVWTTNRKEKLYSVALESFWKGIFQLISTEKVFKWFFKKISDLVDKALNSERKQVKKGEEILDVSGLILYVITCVEFISGLIRSLKSIPISAEKEEKIWKVIIIPIYEKLFQISNRECILEICESITTSFEERDFRRSIHFFDLVMKNFSPNNFFMFNTNDQLRMLTYIVRFVPDINWQDYQKYRVSERCIDTILGIVQSRNDMNKMVRDRICMFCANLFRNMYNLNGGTFYNKRGEKIQNNRLIGQFESSTEYCKDKMREAIKNFAVKTISKGCSCKDTMCRFIVAFICDQFFFSYHAFDSEMVLCVKTLLIVQTYVIESGNDHVIDSILQKIIDNGLLLISNAVCKEEKKAKEIFNFIIQILIDWSFDFEGMKVNLKKTSKIIPNLIEFVLMFYYLHKFTYLEEENEKLIKVLRSLISIEKKEIRQAANTCFASVLRLSKEEKVTQTTKEVVMALSKCNVNNPGVSGEIFCGCAIVQAYPFSMPKFMPKLLLVLGRFIYSNVHVIRERVKEMFNNFWKTHTAKWKEYEKLFTEDELELVNSFKVSPSYYS